MAIMMIGKKDSTGPVPAPSKRRPPAPLKDRDHQTEGRADGEQIHDRRDEGDYDTAEGDHEQQTTQQDDDAHEKRQFAREHRGEVHEDGGDATDEYLRVRGHRRRRDVLVANRRR
jgi:hypothetical protein